MRTPLTLLAALAAATLLLTGCQGGDPQTAEETPAPTATSEPTAGPSETEESTPEPEGTVVEVTIDGDNVSPNGDRVEAEVGEPITFQITSDRAGELHVHSTPEQEVPFAEGMTEVQVTIDQPGVVEVEDHDSGLVIVQLEVS